MAVYLEDLDELLSRELALETDATLPRSSARLIASVTSAVTSTTSGSSTATKPSDMTSQLSPFDVVSLDLDLEKGYSAGLERKCSLLEAQLQSIQSENETLSIALDREKTERGEDQRRIHDLEIQLADALANAEGERAKVLEAKKLWRGVVDGLASENHAFAAAALAAPVVAQRKMSTLSALDSPSRSVADLASATLSPARLHGTFERGAAVAPSNGMVGTLGPAATTQAVLETLAGLRIEDIARRAAEEVRGQLLPAAVETASVKGAETTAVGSPDRLTTAAASSPAPAPAAARRRAPPPPPPAAGAGLRSRGASISSSAAPFAASQMTLQLSQQQHVSPPSHLSLAALTDSLRELTASAASYTRTPHLSATTASYYTSVTGQHHDSMHATIVAQPPVTAAPPAAARRFSLSDALAGKEYSYGGAGTSSSGLSFYNSSVSIGSATGGFNAGRADAHRASSTYHLPETAPAPAGSHSVRSSFSGPSGGASSLAAPKGAMLGHALASIEAGHSAMSSEVAAMRARLDGEMGSIAARLAQLQQRQATAVHANGGVGYDHS